MKTMRCDSKVELRTSNIENGVINQINKECFVSLKRISDEVTANYCVPKKIKWELLKLSTPAAACSDKEHKLKLKIQGEEEFFRYRKYAANQALFCDEIKYEDVQFKEETTCESIFAQETQTECKPENRIYRMDSSSQPLQMDPLQGDLQLDSRCLLDPQTTSLDQVAKSEDNIQDIKVGDYFLDEACLQQYDNPMDLNTCNTSQDMLDNEKVAQSGNQIQDIKVEDNYLDKAPSQRSDQPVDLNTCQVSQDILDDERDNEDHLETIMIDGHSCINRKEDDEKSTGSDENSVHNISFNIGDNSGDEDSSFEVSSSDEEANSSDDSESMESLLFAPSPIFRSYMLQKLNKIEKAQKKMSLKLDQSLKLVRKRLNDLPVSIEGEGKIPIPVPTTNEPQNQLEQIIKEEDLRKELQNIKQDLQERGVNKLYLAKFPCALCKPEKRKSFGDLGRHVKLVHKLKEECKVKYLAVVKSVIRDCTFQCDICSKCVVDSKIKHHYKTYHPEVDVDQKLNKKMTLEIGTCQTFEMEDDLTALNKFLDRAKRDPTNNLNDRRIKQLETNIKDILEYLASKNQQFTRLFNSSLNSKLMRENSFEIKVTIHKYAFNHPTNSHNTLRTKLSHFVLLLKDYFFMEGLDQAISTRVLNNIETIRSSLNTEDTKKKQKEHFYNRHHKYTNEEIAAMFQSDYFKSNSEILQNEEPLSENAVETRDILMFSLSCLNAQRSGSVANMTMEEYRNALEVEDEDAMQILVAEHQTSSKEPAIFYLNKDLFKQLQRWVEGYRPFLTKDTNDKALVFVTKKGNPIKSTQSQTNKICKKSGFPKHYTGTQRRKQANTDNKRPDLAIKLADSMSPSESVAKKHKLGMTPKNALDETISPANEDEASRKSSEGIESVPNTQQKNQIKVTENVVNEASASFANCGKGNATEKNESASRKRKLSRSRSRSKKTIKLLSKTVNIEDSSFSKDISSKDTSKVT